MTKTEQESGRVGGLPLLGRQLWWGLSARSAVTALGRRVGLCLFAGLLALVATPGLARTVTDSAGRPVELPDKVTRVFAAGPPAAVLLYVLAPHAMIGWPNALPPAAKPFVLPSVRDLPVLERLTGRGHTLRLDLLIAARPDLIIDFGTVNETYRSLADSVQSQTGIPYLLIDGRLDKTPAALRLVGDVLDLKERGEVLARAAEMLLTQVDHVIQKVPADQRPRIYFARGSDGLEARPRGTVSSEIITRIGGIDVVKTSSAKGGHIKLTLQQLAAFAPDTIITLDRDFQQTVSTTPEWQSLPALEMKRVFRAPALPFGFIGVPPSVNRLLGLTWLLHTLYPEHAPGDLRNQMRAFYRLFYQVELSDAKLDQLLTGANE